MLSPLAGWVDRELLGVFTVATALPSGTAVDISSADTSPLTPSPYGNSFGTVVAATSSEAFVQSGTTPFAVTDVGLGRPLGWLLQPVNSTGPSLLEIMTQVYDENILQGGTAAVLPAKAGAFIATDQFSSGTGAVKFDGTVPLGTQLGVNAGLLRVRQAGDTPIGKFVGQVVQRNTACAAFQIL